MNKSQDNLEPQTFLKKKRGRKPGSNKENNPKSLLKSSDLTPVPNMSFKDFRLDQSECAEKDQPSHRHQEEEPNDDYHPKKEEKTAMKEKDEEIHTTLMKLFGSTMAMMMRLNETVKSKVCVKCNCKMSYPQQSLPYNSMNLARPQFPNPLFRVQNFPHSQRNMGQCMSRYFNPNLSQNRNYTSNPMIQKKRYPPMKQESEF